MALKIKKAAVLGAGVMGAQIAAHLAGAGIRVHLLDLKGKEPPKDPKLAKKLGGRIESAPAILAMERLKTLRPPPLFTPDVIDKIVPGNFEDDLAVISECDWVIEAVVENLSIKVKIHELIKQYARADIPISTNTSGISLEQIIAEFEPEYAARFQGVHFFNPPRYMKLVEVIPHETSDMKLVGALSNWIEEKLGKGIVLARDTVNFIANRIGVYNIQTTFVQMESENLNIETVDSLTGKLMGRPSSATFRTMDVVGLDTFSFVAKNVYDRATEDPCREEFLTPFWVVQMIKDGRHGQKSGEGFYKKTKDSAGKKQIQVYDSESKSYRPQNQAEIPWLSEALKIPDLAKRLSFAVSQDDAAGRFVWKVLAGTMCYAAYHVSEIADGKVIEVDNAMKWGFNWQMGPFELWQAMGYDALLERMQKDGRPLPSWAKSGVKFYEPSPSDTMYQLAGPAQALDTTAMELTAVKQDPRKFVLPTTQIEKAGGVVFSNKSASLVDLGDGIAALTFHSKMNAIDDDILSLTQQAVLKVRQDFSALVIANNHPRAFSAGANLKQILDFIDAKNFDAIDGLLRQFQGSLQLLKFAPFPVVACPHGLTLGGGCEFTLHASHRLVAAETYAGLVEAGVGLIPAAGGTKELALRAYKLASLGEKADVMPFIQKMFEVIGMAKVSTSGHDAIRMGLYPEQNSQVTLSRDLQVFKAKTMALGALALDYSAPIPKSQIPAAGDPGIQTIRMALYNMKEGGFISDYDAVVGEKIATVLCGGEVDRGTLVDEQRFLDLGCD